MTANMATEKTFYTDSNGRDFIKRVNSETLDFHWMPPFLITFMTDNLNIGISRGSAKFARLTIVF